MSENSENPVLAPELESELCASFREMFGCDQARISTPCGKLFLILGWEENTAAQRERDPNCGQWYDECGNPVDFNYIREEVVASGHSAEELKASAAYYKRLLSLSWGDYFRDQGEPELGAAVEKALGDGGESETVRKERREAA